MAATVQTQNANVNSDDGSCSSKSSQKNTASNTTDKLAQFWKEYSKVADDQDEDFLEKNGSNIEGVMLFAGLFSAVLASFLASIKSDLKPDPTSTTNALLMMLVHSINNTALADEDLGIPVWNGPSSAVVCSQALGYAALSASLLAALGAVLGKQWLSDFTRLRNGPLQDRYRRHQQKLDGLKTWKFRVFMGALPALIQLALLLFSIALSVNLWELNYTVGSVVIAATAIGVFFYIFITVASLVFPACPFRTPISSTIHSVTGTIMKSVEEIAEYWAWRTSDLDNEIIRPTISRGNRILAYIFLVFTSPLLIVLSSIFLTVLTALGPYVFAVWVRGRGVLIQTQTYSYRSSQQFKAVQKRIHTSICRLRGSARSARDFMRTVYLNPEPDSGYSDPRAIAWLLETSTDPDCLMAAAELVPDVKWPEDLDISLPVEHLYSIFIRSIPERGANDRALRLGKAFIIMLFQMSKEVRNRVWETALQHVTEESKHLRPDVDSDLLFILSIVAKLLSLKLGLSADVAVEFPKTCEVSQSLLVWLLQPLETLLRPDHSHQSLFLPEAYRAFLKLGWPEESKSEGVQYFRTFEIYFNNVVGANVEEVDQTNKQNSQDFNQLQVDHLKRILEKLKRVDVSQARLQADVHQHLIVPLTVLSRLASISYLKQAFNETLINPWMVKAFQEAIHIANEGGVGGSLMWLFAGCIMKLATALDAFNPIEGPVLPPQANGDNSGQIATIHMDSKSLLSYLLHTGSPSTVTSEQIVYALEIVHRNVEELPELASNPAFVNYILYATGPGQVYTIHHIGSKVLIAGCQYLLRAYDTQSLMELADHCDLVRFLRRAILDEDPPTMLQHLLLNSNNDFKTNLLRILSPSLGDPFNTLLAKLNEEPHKIPERDLRNMEIALVLSKGEDRKMHLYDHLDNHIASIALRPGDFKDTMALPLTVIVGWLLRRGGPLSASEDVCTALIRPDFEELLFAAWGDLETLEDNPHMLRLLLICTGRWVLTYPASGTGSSSRSLSTLARLRHVLRQLLSESMAFSSDIKKALQRLFWQVEQPQGAKVEGNDLRL